MKAIQGTLIECEAAIKSILVHLDEKHKFIIEDLDETHLFIKADQAALVKKLLDDRLKETYRPEEPLESDDNMDG